MKNTILTIAASVIAVFLVGFTGYHLAPQSVQQKLGSYYSSVGAIFQTDPTFVNVLSGTTVTSQLIEGSQGFQIFSTSTALTTQQLLTTSNEQWINTTAVATATLPAATTTWLAAGSPAYGSWNANWVTNNSTNTVNTVAGAGMVFKCANGTSTIVGVSCSPTVFSLPASTTVWVQGFWITSSTFWINWGSVYL